MIVAWLLKLGLSGRFATGLARIGVPLLVLALLGGGLWWLRSDAHSDGRRFERARVEAEAAEAKAAQAERERIAEIQRRRQEAVDRIEAAKRTKEIDDATRHIPDQAPTARQRARACIELRAQARAAGRPQPAC